MTWLKKCLSFLKFNKRVLLEGDCLITLEIVLPFNLMVAVDFPWQRENQAASILTLAIVVIFLRGLEVIAHQDHIAIQFHWVMYK